MKAATDDLHRAVMMGLDDLKENAGMGLLEGLQHTLADAAKS